MDSDGDGDGDGNLNSICNVEFILDLCDPGDDVSTVVVGFTDMYAHLHHHIFFISSVISIVNFIAFHWSAMGASWANDSMPGFSCRIVLLMERTHVTICFAAI